MDDIENYNSVVKQSDVLKKRGDDGWELVSTILIGTLTRIRFYWKKFPIFFLSLYYKYEV